MNKAYIYYNSKSEGKDYCGEGMYVLIFNDEVIARHYCSNRNFANHDLTAWRLEELERNNIDEVTSNGEIVWAKQNQEINKKTQREFDKANLEYEAKYCR